MKIKLLAILFISFLLASCSTENTQSESTNIPQMIEGLINKVIDQATFFLERSMKLKLLAILFISFLLASCASENTQSESLDIGQTLGGYVKQATDYIGNLY